MVENKKLIFGIAAMIIGASGLGLGIFSVVNFQVVEGPQGKDAPGGLVVGILDPDYGETLFGNIIIRAIIYGIESYTLSIQLNGTEIGTSLPMVWDTETVTDGLWNITVIVTDTLTNNISSDEVLVFVKNIQIEYPCSLEVEIKDALDRISTSFGKIIITESITLYSTININGGGNYVIQGYGAGTVIDCGGDWNIFNITNATSCIIKDLKINASNIGVNSTAIINIDEMNDNPVYIESVQIIGDLDRLGYGIYIGSGNVWVSDCYIGNVFGSIYQPSGVEDTHIYNNIVFDCGFNGMEIHGDYNYISGNSLDTGDWSGISINGSFNMIIDNLIRDFNYGIILMEDNNIINDNNMHSIQTTAIGLGESDNNIISGNHISDVGNTGIFLGGSDNNAISGNHISDTEGDGIFLTDCDNNVISGNHISDSEFNGIYIFMTSYYNVISGNIITNLHKTIAIDLAGIYLDSDVDFTTINGNGIFNCTSSGGANGYGILIQNSNCNDNTVIGNTALYNDINWYDIGTNTIGNETNNNFS